MTDLVLGKDSSGSKIIISRKEQRNSLYVIGKSGSGKSTLLLNMIKQTMDQEIGMALIDPHSSLINQTIAIATPEQRKRIILIDITDEEYCCGLNLYECPNPHSKKAVNDTVERIMLLWDKLFHITTKEFPQISEYMRQAAHTIVVNPGYTMAEVYKLFRDKEFRNRLLANVQNQSVKEFWEDYDNLPNFERHNQLAAVRRRLSEFLTDMVIPIVGQAKSTINMSEIMDARPGKILLVKLARNQESVSSLIGSMLISLIRIAGFERDENQGKHFIVYSDEFSNYASSEYQTIVSELRKYAVCTVMSHQDRYILEQQVPELLRSTLGTNIVVFSLNSIDAEVVKWRFDNTPPEPEMEERGREEILVPKHDSLNHLLANGHQNHIINTFINEYIRKTFNEIQLLQAKAQESSMLREIYLGYNNESQQIQNHLNQLFYDTMITKNGNCAISIDLLFIFARYFGFSRYIHVNLSPQATSVITYILSTDDFKNAMIQSRTMLIDALLVVEKENLYRNMEIYRRSIIGQIKSRDWTNRPVAYVDFVKKLYDSFPWMHIEQIQNWQQLIENGKDPYHGIDYDDDIYKSTVVYFIYTNQKLWFTQADKEQQIENKKKELIQEQLLFENFILQFRAMLHILAKEEEHITTGSGQYQPIYRPGQQLSSAEMAARTSNKLTTLPNFTAYTRIGGNEYTITITPPAYAPVDVKAVTNKIIQQNFRDGYIRKRSDVEAEIAARQQPPAPQPTSPQVGKPAAQPNIPAKRKAAIGKICPKCGANNAATSLYCSQDGTKLE